MPEKRLDLTTSVMNTIRHNKVDMRPHIYFVVVSLLTGAGLAGLVAVTTFLASLMFFGFRMQRPFSYLAFGLRGVRPFLVTMPWIPLGLMVVGLVGGWVLLRRYDFSYQKSLTALFLGLTAFVLTLGAIFQVTGLNEKLAQKGHLNLMRSRISVGEDWVAGEVTGVGDKQLTLVTFREEVVSVVWDEHTHLPSGGDFLIGDKVQAVGSWEGNVFKARGLNKGPANYSFYRGGDHFRSIRRTSYTA